MRARAADKLEIVKRHVAQRVHSSRKADGKNKIHLLAVLSFDRRATKSAIMQERDEFQQRLHDHLNQRCLVTIKRRQIRVEIEGKFTADELHHLACGVQRVWEWEAA